jgi:hypothetical protein
MIQIHYYPFADEADFSGITGQKNLAIDKLIHKTFVEVSEKGTEVAAASAVVLKEIGSAMPNKEKIINFKADHPFIFMINDQSTGQILFTGVVNHPEKYDFMGIFMSDITLKYIIIFIKNRSPEKFDKCVKSISFRLFGVGFIFS